MKRLKNYKIPTFTKVLRLRDQKVFSNARGAALGALFEVVDGVYLKTLPRGVLPKNYGEDFSFGIIKQFEKDIAWCCEGYLGAAGPNLDNYEWIYDCPARGTLPVHHPDLLESYFRSMEHRDRFVANPVRRALKMWMLQCGDPERERNAGQLY